MSHNVTKLEVIARLNDIMLSLKNVMAAPDVSRSFTIRVQEVDSCKIKCIDGGAQVAMIASDDCHSVETKQKSKLYIARYRSQLANLGPIDSNNLGCAFMWGPEEDNEVMALQCFQAAQQNGHPEYTAKNKVTIDGNVDLIVPPPLPILHGFLLAHGIYELLPGVMREALEGGFVDGISVELPPKSE